MLLAITSKPCNINIFFNYDIDPITDNNIIPACNVLFSKVSMFMYIQNEPFLQKI